MKKIFFTVLLISVLAFSGCENTETKSDLSEKAPNALPQQDLIEDSQIKEDVDSSPNESDVLVNEEPKPIDTIAVQEKMSLIETVTASDLNLIVTKSALIENLNMFVSDENPDALTFTLENGESGTVSNITVITLGIDREGKYTCVKVGEDDDVIQTWDFSEVTVEAGKKVNLALECNMENLADACVIVSSYKKGETIVENHSVENLLAVVSSDEANE